MHKTTMHRGGWSILLLLASCGGFEKTVAVRNTPPNVTIEEPGSGSDAKFGDEVEFVARVGDDADSPSSLSLTWTSDVQGAFEDTSTVDDGTGQVLWSTAALDLGTHVIALEVVDSKGEAGRDTVEIEILDREIYPDISIVHPSGDEAGMEGEIFEFVAQVYDEQDDPDLLRVSFVSDVDGEFCDDPEPDAIGIVSCEAILSVGDHLLTFSVMDRDGHEVDAGPKAFTVGSLLEVDDDGDGFTENQNDCDDDDVSIHPGAEEVYNGADDDCDGIIDEGTIGYDDDGDGWSEVEGDCDDTNPAITFEDCDGDGYIAVEFGGDDCDDTSADVHPGAAEICDTLDNDCDGQADEEGSSGCSLYYEDLDGDGYGSSVGACTCGPTGDFTSTSSTDCYDGNAEANPGYTGWATSHRGDSSWDWDCSGAIESEWGSDSGSCSCSDFLCVSGCDWGPGWSGGDPGCGASRSYITGCDHDFFSDCDADTVTRTQGCH